MRIFKSVLGCLVLSLAVLACFASSKTEPTGNSADGKNSPAGTRMEVSIEPSNKLVHFISSQNGPEVADRYDTSNGKSVITCFDQPTTLEVYHDPTPDDTSSLALEDKTPIEDPTPPITEEQKTEDKSDWKVLARIAIPAKPCDKKLLKLKYTFGDEISLTYELTEF